jgi:membrane-associated phospholipid phosphatase
MRTFISSLFLVSIAFAQVEPNAGQWKTWVIPSGSSMRVPPPPQDATEIQAIKNSTANLDQAALNTIHYWDAGAPVYRWMQIAQQYVVNSTLAGPQQTRALSLVAAAISDATIAAWDSKYTYNRQHPSEVDSSIVPQVAVPRSPSYPSEHAAAAGAAAAVLAYLFPDQAAKILDTASNDANSRVMAGVAFPSDVQAGLQLGQTVGAAVVGHAKLDGSDQQFTGSFPAAQGVWSSANPVTPLAGTWMPWVVPTAGVFRPAAPPAFGSPEAIAQYAAVKNLNRTNATNHLAWFWQPNFFQAWLQQVDLEMFQNHLDLNPPRAARAYAYETIAQHDAALACWDAKFTYLELRPSQADSTITPLFGNPQHPGYPSGHACTGGASAAIMSFLFPADTALFAQMGNDAGNSTFDAEIHTPLDVSAGFAMGTKVGQAAAARGKSDGAN